MFTFIKSSKIILVLLKSVNSSSKVNTGASLTGLIVIFIDCVLLIGVPTVLLFESFRVAVTLMTNESEPK